MSPGDVDDVTSSGWDVTTNATVNGTSLSSPYPSVLQVVAMWALPILMVTLNTIVFIVVPRMRTVKPCTGYGMLSLAAADFSLGVVHLIRLSYNSYSNFHLESSDPVCIIDGYGQSLFASVSIVTLTYMNLDRLLTIALPLWYPRQLTRTKVLLIHGAIWGCMIALLAPVTTGVTGTRVKYYPYAFMCVPDWAGSLPYNLVEFTLVMVIPTGVIMASFIGIFYYARHRNPKLAGSGRRIHHGQQDESEAAQWKRDMRIFRTLAIMTFGFYIAWTPYFVTVALPEMITGYSLHPVTDFITPWLGASNSFWNAIIYIPTMRPFSQALRQLGLKLCPWLCPPGGVCCRRKPPGGQLPLNVNNSRSGTQENVGSASTHETPIPSHTSSDGHTT